MWRVLWQALQFPGPKTASGSPGSVRWRVSPAARQPGFVIQMNWQHLPQCGPFIFGVCATYKRIFESFVPRLWFTPRIPVVDPVVAVITPLQTIGVLVAYGGDDRG